MISEDITINGNRVVDIIEKHGKEYIIELINSMDKNRVDSCYACDIPTAYTGSKGRCEVGYRKNSKLVGCNSCLLQILTSDIYCIPKLGKTKKKYLRILIVYLKYFLSAMLQNINIYIH